MVYVESDVIVIASSQLPVPLRIVDEDGNAIDLSGATKAQLRLQNINSSAELITFSTDDDTPLLSFDDIANGLLELNPATDSFTDAGTYRYQIWVFWDETQYCFPDDGLKTVAKWVVEANIQDAGAES